MAAGQQLKSLRERLGITVRHVEEASRRVARAAGNPKYQISNGWLVQLENRASPPNIYHLLALCAIYHVQLDELLRIYGINLAEQSKYEAVATPHLTRLIFTGSAHFNIVAPATTTLAEQLKENLPMESTFERNNGHSRVIYAQLGEHEVTMYPLIRPGSILTIDTDQTRIETGPWNNKHERPIYVVETRDGVTCGWCERSDHKLRIISYGSSLVKELTYPQDAEIVGRVIAYYTPCVDPEDAQPIKRRVTKA